MRAGIEDREWKAMPFPRRSVGRPELSLKEPAILPSTRIAMDFFDGLTHMATWDFRRARLNRWVTLDGVRRELLSLPSTFEYR